MERELRKGEIYKRWWRGGRRWKRKRGLKRIKKGKKKGKWKIEEQKGIEREQRNGEIDKG